MSDILPLTKGVAAARSRGATQSLPFFCARPPGRPKGGRLINSTRCTCDRAGGRVHRVEK
jgi:hypothetical protein